MFGAFVNELQRFQRLLHVVVLRVFIEAVDQLHEVVLDQPEIQPHRHLQSLEGRHNQVLLGVLGG